MFGTKERTIIPVNEHPAVVAMRENLLAARSDLSKWEAEEMRLKRILDPPPSSSTYSSPDPTVREIREARERLKADLGVTVPSHFYLVERRAAQRVVEDLESEAQRARDQASEELKTAVRERVASLAKDFQAAFQSCQALAGALLQLQDDSGVTVPQIHSCLPYSNVANELAAVKLFATGN